MNATAVLTEIRPSAEPDRAHYTYRLTADAGRLVQVLTVHGDARAGRKARAALVVADGRARLAELLPSAAIDLAYREAPTIGGAYSHLALALPPAPVDPT